MSEATSGEQPSADSSGSVPIERIRAEYPRFSWKVFLIWFTAVTAGYCMLALVHDDSRQERNVMFTVAPVGGLFVSVFYYGIYVLIRRGMYNRMLRRLDVAKIQARTENLQQDLEQDFFTNLVKINFKYIDRYYLQTQIQADKSFLMSAISAFVGLATVVAGIVLMYLGKTSPRMLAQPRVSSARL
jgi:hypothetical protein